MAISSIIATTNSSPQLSSLNINDENFKKLEEEFLNFEKNMFIISEVEEGDKLARSTSGIYFIHRKNEWFVQPRRWWGNQGRKQTFNHLDEDFTKFMKYLDKILESLIFILDTRYNNLAKNVIKMVDNLITGLYNLKKTYPEEKELICKIDSIILSMIDFKREYNSKNNTVIRPRAFSD